MTIHRFRKIALTVRKRGFCSYCEKTVTRQRTLWQTLNPWNKTGQGAPKTEEDIRAELRAQAAGWTPDYDHEQCRHTHTEGRS